MNLDKLASQMTEKVTMLLATLKGDIQDDYRATNDPDDNTPGMQVTIASNDGENWTYQTGDNSYSGGCYGYRHWGVGYLYRDTDCAEEAARMVNEVFEGIESQS